MDNPYRQKILKAIQKLGQVHSVWDVFSDFVELGALCIANSIEVKGSETWEKREKQYLDRQIQAGRAKAIPRNVRGLGSSPGLRAYLA